MTDTCIPEETAVRRLEGLLLEQYKQACDKNECLLPSEFFMRLLLNGDLEQFYQSNPRDSWLLAAAEKNIPVFTPGWEDSTCGNIIVANLLKGQIPHSPVKSGLDQMELGFCFEHRHVVPPSDSSPLRTTTATPSQPQPFELLIGVPASF